MCIIIAQPAGLEISLEAMKESWTNNRDGAGIMYAHKNKIHIFKELTDFDKVYKHYKRIVTQYPDKNIVVHFRIGTSGKKDLKNCHPFLVNKQLAFCHNGMIDIKLEKDSLHSDTVEFRNEILRKLPSNFLSHGPYVRLIRTFIGHSKLCFLDSTGKLTIVKDNLGVWDNGIWYSNSGYKPKEYNNYQYYNESIWSAYYDNQGRWKPNAKNEKASKQHHKTNCISSRANGLLSNPAGSNDTKKYVNPYFTKVKVRDALVEGGLISDPSLSWFKAKEALAQRAEWNEKSDSTEKDIYQCDVCDNTLQYYYEIKQNRCSDCIRLSELRRHSDESVAQDNIDITWDI